MVLLTSPVIRDSPVIGRIRGKVAIFNENVHTVVLRHDAVVATAACVHRPVVTSPDSMRRDV